MNQLISNFANYQKRLYILPLLMATTLGLFITFSPLLWQTNYILIALALAAVTLTVFFRRDLGFYLIVILVPVEATFIGFSFITPHLHTSDFLPLYPWFVMVVLAGILIRNAAGIKKMDISTPLDIIVGLFFLWATISLLWAPNITEALHDYLKFFVSISMFYVAVAVTQDRNIQKNSVIVLIIWGVVIAALSIASLHFLRSDYGEKYKLSQSIIFNLFIRHSNFRAKAITPPTYTVFVLNFALSFAICMFAWLKPGLKKILLFIGIIILMFGVLETKSKGGIGTMLIMITTFNIVLYSFRKKMIRNLLFYYVIFISLFIFQMQLEDRTPRIVGTEEMSFTVREHIWSHALREFLGKSPVGGLGIGGARYYVYPWPHGHSIYFTTFFDFGIIGVLLLAVLLFILFRTVLRSLTLQNTFPQMMLMGSFGCLLNIGVHGLVDYSYLDHFIWFFLGITMGALKLVEAEKKQPVPVKA